MSKSMLLRLKCSVLSQPPHREPPRSAAKAVTGFTQPSEGSGRSRFGFFLGRIVGYILGRFVFFVSLRFTRMSHSSKILVIAERNAKAFSFSVCAQITPFENASKANRKEIFRNQPIPSCPLIVPYCANHTITIGEANTSSNRTMGSVLALGGSYPYRSKGSVGYAAAFLVWFLDEYLPMC